MHAYLQTYIHIWIDAYIHTYIHTYIYIYISKVVIFLPHVVSMCGVCVLICHRNNFGPIQNCKKDQTLLYPTSHIMTVRNWIVCSISVRTSWRCGAGGHVCAYSCVFVGGCRCRGRGLVCSCLRVRVWMYSCRGCWTSHLDVQTALLPKWVRNVPEKMVLLNSM